MSDKVLFTSKFTASAITRPIPEPKPTIEDLYKTVRALTEVVRTLSRSTGDPYHSAVTVRDLYELGYADLI